MGSPLVSVIIPIYNVESCLQRCLDSVVSQSYHNMEIILVDDGSTDQCGKIADAYAEKDLRIQVIHQKNQGLSMARNVAIDIAKGKFMTFIDSDDFVHDEFVSRLIETQEAFQADIVICEYQYFSEIQDIGVIEDNQIELLDKKECIHDLLSDRMRSYAWAKLYRTGLFQKIRYPKGRLFEDIATTYLVFDKASKIVMRHQKLYYYYFRPGAITNTDVWEKWYHMYLGYREMYQFALKYYPEFQMDSLSRTMDMALAVCNKRIKGMKVTEQAVKECGEFLQEHKKQIPALLQLNQKRKRQMKIWTSMPGVFVWRRIVHGNK